jgi:hypothetical protein
LGGSVAILLALKNRLGANGNPWQRSPAGNTLPKRLRQHAQHAFSKALDGEFQPEGLGLRVLCFPNEEPQPPLDVASRADEEVLQFDFAETPLTAAAHAVPTRQFTQGAFNRVALVHPLHRRLR